MNRCHPITLLVFLLVSVAAASTFAIPIAAQTPEPAAFYPLGIGDIREYRVGGYIAPDLFLRERVVGDTLIADTSYRLVITSNYNRFGEWMYDDRAAVRFDSRTGMIEVGAGWAWAPLCPFGLEYPDCPYGGTLTPDVATLDGFMTTVYSISVVFDDCSFAAGLGLYYRAFEASDRTQELVYARVSGVSYGTPIPYLPTSGDPSAPLSSNTLAVQALPNPTIGPLELTVTLPEPGGSLAVEAFDALGRRVHHEAQTLPAGDHRLGLDASRWTPGLYVVRVTTPDGTASVRVVRR
jgi:hypothetical protein